MATILIIAAQFKRYAAGLALCGFAVTLLAVALATGPTQAQGDTPTPAPTPTTPQPCGEGAAIAFQPEPHERTSGHYALFDAYWERTEPDPAETPGIEGERRNTGLLHTNECPPLVSKTENDEGETVVTWTASGVDIDDLIIHVEDSRQVTVVQGDPDDPDSQHATSQLRLDQYPEVEKHASTGDKVWWLQLDDPGLNGEQTSDLTLGFSTHRFDETYWTKIRYEFRLERNPGFDPDEHPHLLAYRARQSDRPRTELVWDSAQVGVTAVEMAPGVPVNDLQWIFTKAGTYKIYVQPVGYVRQTNPHRPGEEGYDANWRPISANETEPGEVKTYVIHVGPLKEVEPPQLGIGRSVPENSPTGANVGDPILVFSEASDLEYSLFGDGHDNFAVTATVDTDPYSVQITVAEDANLDYDTKSIYDLTLAVTNKIDHESNPDASLDDTLLVRIV
ncbi:MAG: cadherin repeat domain-containing protein, partial [bacterium]|nr:cadherin repeat domain-containing protein [bacterium]